MADPDLADLLARLDSEEPGDRLQAIKALGQAGEAARSAYPLLVGELDHADPMIRAMAASTLGKIGASFPEVVSGLCRHLDDPVFPVRFWVCDALGRLGADAAQALPLLEGLCEDEHKAVRAAARKAVARIKKQSTAR